MRSWTLSLALALMFVGPIMAVAAPSPAANSAAAAGTTPSGNSLQGRGQDSVEHQPRRPSGFWTSTRPAKGGAYRYRLLGIGVVIVLITLGFMLWLIRRKGQPTT